MGAMASSYASHAKVVKNGPEDAYGKAAVFNEGGKEKVLVFGGYASQPSFVFDVAESRWDPLVTTGEPPGDRACCTAEIVGRILVVCGGFDTQFSQGENYCVNDMHHLYLDTLR